jgi:cell fate regulator YaaT (PSP1 superfamily)
MRIVQVRFPGSRRIYSFDAGPLEIAPGDVLVVEGERGARLGSAVEAPKEGPWTLPEAPTKVERKAADDDLRKGQEFKARETEAMTVCRRSVVEHNLPMKLVKAEYVYDGSKIVFFFTAEGRVDFRELVRKLAQRLRTRIEMHQIGVRDEAKLLGGLGVCGRVFCCSGWLSNFSPVSIRMAKDQGLSLNPAKVSGGCGRLLCCLSYEQDIYADFRVGLPKVGKRVMSPKGIGRVSRYDIFTGKIYLSLEEGREEAFERQELQPLTPPNAAHAPAAPAGPAAPAAPAAPDEAAEAEADSDE